MSRANTSLLARAALFLLLTGSAVLCLLVDIPFTYQAVVRAGLVAWLPAVMKAQPWALLMVVAANAWVDRLPGPGFKLAPARWALLGVSALIALALAGSAGLPGLEPGLLARVAALAFLLIAALMPALDLLEARSGWPQRDEGADDARRLFVAAYLSAILVCLTFFSIGLGRLAAAGQATALTETATTLGWSLLAHGLVIGLLGVAALGLQAWAVFFERAREAEFLITLTAVAGFVAMVLVSVVFPGIAFAGAFAWVVAMVAGLGLACWLAAIGLHLGPRGQLEGSSLEVFLRPFHPVRPSGLSLTLGLLLAFGLALAVGLKVSSFDWNFLFQQLGAILVATLVFAAIYLRQSVQPIARSWGPRLFMLPLCLLALFRLWGTPAAQPGWLARPSAKAVEAHAGFDASVRLVAGLLRPAAADANAIYPWLLANSNIAHAVKVAAKDLQLVERLTPASGERPDIYIFVVDSLRQDYLGAYNKSVSFTPNIDRFAAESTVFPKAFTRYGATGLSEPSIWVGGMMLHKQYIVPFHPLNTLQKLVQADGYRSFVSMDSILDVVVKPMPDLVRLDAGKSTSDLRLGATLKDLQAQLELAPVDRPVFAYSQAQDVHISSLNREGLDVPGGGDYTGFYAPYASRVRRLDAEFGAFIQYLKDRGRYDRSLIVLTADHGDSLGEEGRFGHAYTLFPEIMKIPLILHVPDKLKAGMLVDSSRAAFLTDITPTLYQLLGHRPLTVDPVMGRPLFTTSQAERDRYRREHFLIASSYGAVWGILSGDGDSLYIADGVNFTDHYFDLGATAQGRRLALTPATKQRYDRLILQELDRLNAFYSFKPGKASP